MQREKQIKEIVLYGAGIRGERVLKQILCTDIEHIYVVDSDEGKWGEKLEGYEIFSPDIFLKKEGILFCIAVADKTKREEIRNILKKRYYCEETQEIEYLELMRYIYRNHKEAQKQVAKIPFTNQEKNFIFDCYGGLGLGGIEAWTLDVCSHLCDVYGERVRILSKKGKYHIDSKCRSLVDYIDFVEGFEIEQDIEIILPYLLQKLPCTVITSQPDKLLIMAGAVKKYYGDQLKIISVIHGGSEEIYKNYDVYRNDIDLYVGVSEAIKKDLVARGIDCGQVYSITCPFPCEKKLLRSYTENIAMPLRIGYAGRLEYVQKRMDLLLLCIKMLVERKVNFKIELAGEGAAKLEMENFVTQNNLEDCVKFLGRVSRKDIPDFWRRQDICINLADYEGRSISIIEAMGNGAVPVVTRTSGTKEDIEEDINGYIVSIGDYLAAVDKIEYLANHREILSEMGKLAHDAVYPKSLMKPHIDFWRELLER